jgi:dTDP-4-amino-4,6-dideoxygalactose transaminase
VVAPGFKDNLTDTAAAMGRVQLSRSREMKDKRSAIAARYDNAFAHLPVDLPARPGGPETQHAWHLYVLRLRPESSIDRNEFIERMAASGVGTSVHFIPLHKHPYWRDLRGDDAPVLTVADTEFERVVSLPIFSAMTGAQVERVIDAVTENLR